MRTHGILDGPNGDENVCPGDYIVTDRQKGHFYRMPAAQFESLYEATRPPQPIVNPTPPIGSSRPQDNPEPSLHDQS